MKRRDRLKHLREHGCEFDHAGANHDLWLNPVTNQRAPVERHREIQPTMVREICKQLSIPRPRKK